MALMNPIEYHSALIYYPAPYFQWKFNQISIRGQNYLINRFQKRHILSQNEPKWAKMSYFWPQKCTRYWLRGTFTAGNVFKWLPYTYTKNISLTLLCDFTNFAVFARKICKTCPILARLWPYFGYIWPNISLLVTENREGVSTVSIFDSKLNIFRPRMVQEVVRWYRNCLLWIYCRLLTLFIAKCVLYWDFVLNVRPWPTVVWGSLGHTLVTTR